MKFVAILLLVLCPFCAEIAAQTPVAPGGSGTEGDPYRIESINNLYWLSQHSEYWGAVWYIQTVDIDADSSRDWDGGSGFTPIGNTGVNFTGNYNGNGHTITHLTISRPGEDYIGLFGYLGDGGVVRSLGVCADSIRGNDETGVLAGYIKLGTVRSCYTTGVVTGNADIGSLVGHNFGGTIQYSYSMAVANGQNNVAAFAGVNENGTISSCYATGAANGGTVDGVNYTTGGLVGWNEWGNIENSHSSGTVTGATPIGGLVGGGKGEIRYCYAIDTVNCMTTPTDVGGFLGKDQGMTLIGCLYNKEIFTDTTIGFGIWKSTAEMKTEGTYTAEGWDFAGENTNGTSDPWTISAGINDGYPCFTYQLDVPTVSTWAMTSVNGSTALFQGGIVWLGNTPVTAHGFCWSSTDTLPTIADDIVNLGGASDTGSFSVPYQGLMFNTTYYMRAYATNASDTSYGQVVSFTTLDYDQVQPSGSGVEGDPYLIASLSNLYWLSRNSDAWGGNYFLQTADINADSSRYWDGGNGFTPIGNDGAHFTGKYAGNNHTITHLAISRPSTSYIGLFGVVGSGGTVDSLTVSVDSVRGNENVGALAGYIFGSLNACTSTGSVYGTTNVGGMAGYSDFGNVLFSHSTATVTGSSNVAGLLGQNNHGTVSYCSAVGTVNGGTIDGVDYTTGGLVGTSYQGTIENCYSTGTVTGAGPIGGLIGWSNGNSIIHCYAIDTIQCTTSSGEVSGFMGHSDGDGLFDCFYNNEIFTGTPIGATGMSTLEMKQQTTYTDHGWDFCCESDNGTNDRWAITPVDNSGYPCFVNQTTMPVVGTQRVAGSGMTTATGYGNLGGLGATPVTAYGFCWSNTETSPTTADDTVNLGAASATGDYSVTIAGLTRNTQYYARAYATNAAGTNYGAVVLFRSLMYDLDKPAGSGTEGDPYRIASLRDLYWLTQTDSVWNAVCLQTADINADSTRDWDGGSGLTPIGNASFNYNGTYSGNGHTITHVVIIRPSDDVVGLFGWIGGSGSVRALGVSADSVRGKDEVGILAGYSAGAVHSCNTAGTVTGGTTVGGFIGHNSGGIIDTSHSTASANGLNNVSAFVGSSDNGGQIRYCYSTGSAVGGDSTCYTTAGLVGWNENSTVSNCYSTGAVTGPPPIGGLIGGGNGTIEYSYTIGAVTSRVASADVGGLMGKNNSAAVDSCFYNREIYTDPTGNGTGKTTAEMKLLGTYTAAGWSTGVWAVNESINDGYPYLICQDPGAPLPVELASFTATAGAGAATLQWTTASEVHCAGFDIERRTVGSTADSKAPSQWSKVGYVQVSGTSAGTKSYSYTDKGLATGTYAYRLKQIDNDGSSAYSSAVEVTIAAPKSFALYRNYPNPFNPATTIQYDIPEGKLCHVSLKVYDLVGREVATLVNEQKAPGAYSVRFNASRLSSGVYFYRLVAGNFTAVKKLMLVK